MISPQVENIYYSKINQTDVNNGFTLFKVTKAPAEMLCPLLDFIGGTKQI